MQRSNLQVMVRPRKLPDGAQRGPIKLDKYGHEIEMLNNLFQYDVVFEEDSSQEQVYERLRSAVEKLVEGELKGGDDCMTGSTLLGYEEIHCHNLTAGTPFRRLLCRNIGLRSDILGENSHDWN